MQQYSISSTVQEGTAVGDVRVPDNENTSLPIVMLLHGTHLGTNGTCPIPRHIQG